MNKNIPIIAAICGFITTLLFFILRIWCADFVLMNLLLSALVCTGLILGFVTGIFVKPKIRANLAVAFSLLAFIFTLVVVTSYPSIINDWRIAIFHANATFSSFVKCVLKTASFFLLPQTFALGLLLTVRGSEERIKLCSLTLAGAVIGALLGKFLISCIAIESMLLVSTFLGFVFVWNFLLKKFLKTQIFLQIITVVIFGAFWCITYLGEIFANVNYAAFSVRDMGFMPRKFADDKEMGWTKSIIEFEDSYFGKVTFENGRFIAVEKSFQAAKTSAVMIPFFLKPDAKRFVFRGPDILKFKNVAEKLVSDIPQAEVATGELKGKYDVMFIATPMAGTSDALGFAEERFFRDCSKYLAPNGILTVHYDARTLNARMLLTRISAMQKFLPNVQIWSTAKNDWLIIGSQTPIKASLAKFSEVSERKNMIQVAAECGLNSSAISIVSSYFCSSEGIQKIISELKEPLTGVSMKEPILSQELLYYDSAQGLRVAMTLEPFRDVSPDWILLPEESQEDYSDILKTLQICRSKMVHASFLVSEGKSVEAIRFAREQSFNLIKDPWMSDWVDSLTHDAASFHAIGDFDKALANYAAIQMISEPSPEIFYAAAKTAQAFGKSELACEYFLLAVKSQEKLVPVKYFYDAATALINDGRFEDAESVYDSAVLLYSDEDRRETLSLKSLLMANIENPRFNASAAIKLARSLCEETDWQDEHLAIRLANVMIEAGNVKEGLLLKRSIKEKSQKLKHSNNKKEIK